MMPLKSFAEGRPFGARSPLDASRHADADAEVFAMPSRFFIAFSFFI